MVEKLANNEVHFSFVCAHNVAGKGLSKKVDSNHIRMTDDLDLFKSYLSGNELFGIALSYLKKIHSSKQKEILIRKIMHALHTTFYRHF